MIDLSTTYLGLPLRSPLVCSSSPLSESLDAVRTMEDNGAGAVVMHSLFEEQLEIQSLDLHRFLEEGTESFAEATSYLPDMTQYNLGADGYLEHLRRLRKAVEMPIIASLNGTTPGGWVSFARQLEEAGASALELNIYYLPTDPNLTGTDVENRYLELVRSVSAELKIPVAVKIGPFFSSPANMAKRLDEAGAKGLVLFNRFYQPDFDLENLEVTPTLHLSQPWELLMRLHWTAIIFGRIKADLAITGGIHTGRDVLKCMMAGARVAMVTSVLLKHGVEYLDILRNDMIQWMEEHEYTSIEQMQGSMSLISVGDPSAFERANYMKVLRTYALRMNGIMSSGG